MTQTEEILKFLEAGHTLTPLLALELFGCFRLGARIHELREKGYNIETKPMGGKKRWAMYSLAGNKP